MIQDYSTAVKEFRGRYALQVTAEAGTLGAAMRVTGVHRNTLHRWMKAAGLKHADVRELINRRRAETAKKPVRAVDSAGELRGVA